MTKENLEILEFEDKKTKAGKRYTRFKTSDGWMSCFDKESIEKLKDFEGKTACVEIVESNGFKNIRKFLGASNEDEEEKSPKMSVNRKFDSFPVSMKVSYAKDIFIGEISRHDVTAEFDAVKLMKTCCALVEIAEKEFLKKEDSSKEEVGEDEEIPVEKPEFKSSN